MINIETNRFAKKPGVFYGYWVLAVAFLCTFILSGFALNTFSLFLKPLESDFGWGRGDIILALSICFLVTGIASPLVGSLIDRYGTRGVITAGALITSLGFGATSLIDQLWQFYAAFAIIGLGAAAIGTVPASSLASNWFVKHRGMAVGVMSAGIGAGILGMSPIIGGLLIPNLGWRTSFLFLGCATLILIPLALFVVRTKPADMGLNPDGADDPGDVAETATLYPTPKGLSLKMALHTPAFWLIVVNFLLMGFSASGAIHNQVPHVQDMGFPSGKAAIMLTVFGLGSATGKFSFGWLCDKIMAKHACAISLVLLTIGTVILMSLKPESPLVMVLLSAIILGLGAGGWLPTMSMLVSTNFGLTAYGAIFGTINLAQFIGASLGPLFAGYMYDAMNTYQWAFITFLALYAIAIPAILAVRRPRALEARI